MEGTMCPYCYSYITYGPTKIPFDQIEIVLPIASRDIDDPYDSLVAVLMDAYNQASRGKGKERHAKKDEPFDKQKICEITRRVGLGYPVGQAIKKAEESLRLGKRGPDELLGAINYLAAAVICMREALLEETDED
jgi:hypothetical protein